MASEATLNELSKGNFAIPASLHRCLSEYLSDLQMRILIRAGKKPSGWTRTKNRRALTPNDLLEASRELFSNAAQEFEERLREKELLHATRIAS